jgi:predicted nucleic acid-binding protein
MRLLIDTDVLLDFALNREPHAEAAKRLLAWAATNPGRCAVAWHSLANLNYMMRGKTGLFIRDLLEFVEVPRTGREQMQAALDLGFADLEDAMQTAAAKRLRRTGARESGYGSVRAITFFRPRARDVQRS